MRLPNWVKNLLKTQKKYAASSNSKDRLYHKTGTPCHYMLQIRKQNIKYYKTRNKAEQEGLRYCRICKHHTQQKKIGEYT